jgi:hypothetical protein
MAPRITRQQLDVARQRRTSCVWAHQRWANSVNPGSGFGEIDDQDVVGDGSWELEAEDKSAAGSYSSDGQWSSDTSRKGTSVMASFLRHP